jgi:tetratricopeptide (TPR) repeat protein
LKWRDTESQEAYRLYLLGRYHWGRLTPSEIYRAIGFFEQAIRIDPRYALAYAGLAEAYRALPITSDVPPRDVLPKGKAAALKALEIDAGLAEAQATLCFIQIWSDWDWANAERTCKRAIAINENAAEGHRAYAVLLSDLGKHERAIAEARRARELDPLSLLTNVIEAHALHYAGRNTEALSRLQATLELDRNFWIAHLFTGKVLVAQHRFKEALQEFAKARELSHGNSEAVSLLGYTFALDGDRSAATRALAELLDRSRRSYVPPFNIAMIYNGLGERARTLDWLEKAYADRDVRLTFLKVERKWDPLRSDPRFASLARRMKLG